eukprot:8723679-Alexandrium_andersonii.AAC.1
MGVCPPTGKCQSFSVAVDRACAQKVEEEDLSARVSGINGRIRQRSLLRATSTDRAGIAQASGSREAP